LNAAENREIFWSHANNHLKSALSLVAAKALSVRRGSRASEESNERDSDSTTKHALSRDEFQSRQKRKPSDDGTEAPGSESERRGSTKKIDAGSILGCSAMNCLAHASSELKRDSGRNSHSRTDVRGNWCPVHNKYECIG
jgi:hypothetical protein